jgi:hypothetical protein
MNREARDALLVELGYDALQDVRALYVLNRPGGRGRRPGCRGRDR